jgi:tRNA dimethylallyltransferase
MSTFESLEDRRGLPPLALIAGPTASGKSDLAVRLALALQARGREAVVINADSAQVYADLAVLSARPSAEEMHAIEHRLFGSWDGANACSAADWAEEAKLAIAACHAARQVPIVVGGTGMYISTLLNGIAPVPPIHEAVRDEVRAMDTPALYLALTSEDGGYALQLNRGDRQRLSRALEVVRSTGRSLKSWQRELSGGIIDTVDLHPAVLLPDREWLYARCDARFAAMLERGAVMEVERLLARELDPLLPVMGAIGVREIAAWLRGELDRDAMIAAAQQATRNYAKRQFTWLRNQSPLDWPRFEAQSFDPESIFVSLLRDYALT